MYLPVHKCALYYLVQYCTLHKNFTNKYALGVVNNLVLVSENYFKFRSIMSGPSHEMSRSLRWSMGSYYWRIPLRIEWSSHIEINSRWKAHKIMNNVIECTPCNKLFSNEMMKHNWWYLINEKNIICIWGRNTVVNRCKNPIHWCGWIISHLLTDAITGLCFPVLKIGNIYKLQIYIEHSR